MTDPDLTAKAGAVRPLSFVYCRFLRLGSDGPVTETEDAVRTTGDTVPFAAFSSSMGVDKTETIVVTASFNESS